MITFLKHIVMYLKIIKVSSKLVKYKVLLEPLPHHFKKLIILIFNF